MKKSRTKEDNIVVYLVRPLMIGIMVGVAVCLVLLLLTALALVSSKHIPRDILTILTVIITAISSFMAGLAAAKKLGKRGLFCGALTGGVLFLICLVCSMIWAEAPSLVGAATRFAVMALSGGLGGFFAVRKR